MLDLRQSTAQRTRILQRPQLEQTTTPPTIESHSTTDASNQAKQAKPSNQPTQARWNMTQVPQQRHGQTRTRRVKFTTQTLQDRRVFQVFTMAHSIHTYSSTGTCALIRFCECQLYVHSLYTIVLCIIVTRRGSTRSTNM